MAGNNSNPIKGFELASENKSPEPENRCRGPNWNQNLPPDLFDTNISVGSAYPDAVSAAVYVSPADNYFVASPVIVVI